MAVVFLPVLDAISFAAARHSSSDLLATATSAPASASAVAITLPNPFEPPVTSARFPSSRNISSTFFATIFSFVGCALAHHPLHQPKTPQIRRAAMQLIHLILHNRPRRCAKLKRSPPILILLH